MNKNYISKHYNYRLKIESGQPRHTLSLAAPLISLSNESFLGIYCVFTIFPVFFTLLLLLIGETRSWFLQL